MPVVLSGSTSFFSLEDLLRFAISSGRSCRVRVRRGEVEDLIILEEGKFVIASTSDPDIDLVASASAILPPEPAERLGELFAATGGLLTGTAISRKILSTEDAKKVAAHAVREIAAAALSAGEASFEVDSEPAIEGLDPLDLTLEELLDAAAARAREAEKKIRDTTVLQTAGEIDLDQVTLTASELKLLLKINGERDVAALAGSGDIAATISMLEKLLEMGIVERKTASPAPTEKKEEKAAEKAAPPPPPSEERPPKEEPPPKQEPASKAEPPMEVEPGRTVMGMPAGGFTAACLTVHDESKTSYPLFDEEYSIGRDPSNDLPIPDGSISGKHGRLRRTREGYEFEDLGSRNGTFLNGEKITKAVLKDGDSLRLGKVQMVYSVASAGRPASPTRPGG